MAIDFKAAILAFLSVLVHDEHKDGSKIPVKQYVHGPHFIPGYQEINTICSAFMESGPSRIYLPCHARIVSPVSLNLFF
jgi:hypothetical protein